MASSGSAARHKSSTKKQTTVNTLPDAETENDDSVGVMTRSATNSKSKNKNKNQATTGSDDTVRSPPRKRRATEKGRQYMPNTPTLAAAFQGDDEVSESDSGESDLESDGEVDESMSPKSQGKKIDQLLKLISVNMKTVKTLSASAFA